MAAQEIAYTAEPARARPLEDRVDRLYTPDEARARLGMNTHYLLCLASNGLIEDRDYRYTVASVERFRDELQRYMPLSQFMTEAVHGKKKLRMSKGEVRTLVGRLRSEEPETYQRYFVDILGPKRPSRYRGRSAIPPLWYIEQAKVPEAIAYLRDFSEKVYGKKERKAGKKTAKAAGAAQPKHAIEVVEQPLVPATPMQPAPSRPMSTTERILALRRAAERRREELELEQIAREVATDEYLDGNDGTRGDEW